MSVWKFQSTPVIANGRIYAAAAAARSDSEFQSTPVIANGRIDITIGQGPIADSFNPRPLLLTGESYPSHTTPYRRYVSIHARYC